MTAYKGNVQEYTQYITIYLWLLNNKLFSYNGESTPKNDNEEKPKNIKEAYTDGLKSIGKNVDYAAEFVDIARNRALPEDASIHTVEMSAIKKALKMIHERYIIYTHSQSSIQSIKYNKENKLYYANSVHIGIKGN